MMMLMCGDSEHHNRHSHGWQASGSFAGFDNWRRSELPFGRKLRVALANTWIKVSKRQPCCGHPGEPGC